MMQVPLDGGTKSGETIWILQQNCEISLIRMIKSFNEKLRS